MLELGVGHLVSFIAMVFAACSAVALITAVKHFDAEQEPRENPNVESVRSQAA
jgi:phosphotransferase system  glucose/maltose/N-acetylglucosamine-specific IIC component